MSGVLINVPRSMLLTLNQRLHWRETARRTAELRTIGMLAARRGRLPAMQRARIDATVTWPDRRRRDTHNLAPTAKAIVDGFVDAGVLPDDDDKHLDGPHLHPGPEVGHGGWVAIWFEIAAHPEPADADSDRPRVARSAEWGRPAVPVSPRGSSRSRRRTA